MNNNDKNIVYNALREHGDEFWADIPDPEEGSGNWILFDDVLDACERAGYDLVLVKKQ